MKKIVFRITAAFLFVMTILTFLSWRLNHLRTPFVTVVEPIRASINEHTHSCVLPSSTVDREFGDSCIYIVEKTKSPFYPLIAKRTKIKVEDEANGQAAVSGIYTNGLMAANFTSRPLVGATMPVKVVENPQPLGGWVELLTDDPDTALDILEQHFPEQTPALEEDRIVLHAPTLFTAQETELLLSSVGLQVQTLDYSWGPAMLEQGRHLWKPLAALLTVVLLLALIACVVKKQWSTAGAALQSQYLSDYLRENIVSLLTMAILLVVSVFACILLLRYGIHFPIALPPTLLPQTRLFNGEAYRMWMQTTFPEGLCSPSGTALMHQLSHVYTVDRLLLIGCVAASILIFCGTKFIHGGKKS